MRKRSALSIAAAFVAVLIVAGGAVAATHYIITSTKQIKPGVLRQLKGNRGAQGNPGTPGAPGVVPQVKLVQSPHEALAPGQSTYQVDPNGFQATCPSGYTVLGTGANTGIGRLDMLLSYGTFVGGFVENDRSIPISNVYVQAICGVVPAGATGAAAHRSGRTVYHGLLTSIEQARHRR